MRPTCPLLVLLGFLALLRVTTRAQETAELTAFAPFGEPTMGGAIHPLPALRRLALFEAETDFDVAAGRAVRTETLATWREHSPGFLLAGLKLEGQRGVALPPGEYRWVFRVRRSDEPVQVRGSRLVQLSVWDATSGELLAQRALSASDLETPGVYQDRALQFSTTGRAGHRFEPRVFWEGDVDCGVDSVALESLSGYPETSLDRRAVVLEDLLQNAFLDPVLGATAPGLVVSRPRNASPLGTGTEEAGDSAMRTGYYVAAQAFRRMARPDDAQALANLETGFRALHALHAVTEQPGILARYADTSGNWRYYDPLELRWKSGRVILAVPPEKSRVETWARSVLSKDAYLAYAFAVGVGYPQIQDPGLKATIASDFKAVARHFLDHDFGFESDGHRLDLNPYLSSRPDELLGFLDDFLDPQTGMAEAALRLYREFDQFRETYNDLTSDSEVLDVLSFGCLPAVDRIPTPFITDETAFVRALENRDAAVLTLLLPRVMPDLYARLFWMRDHLRKQLEKLREGFDCVGRFPNTNPGRKFRNVLALGDRVLASLDTLTSRIEPTVSGIRDIRFHVSHSLQAAHLLAVARMISPAEFGDAYTQALDGSAKRLRSVLETWGSTHREWAGFLGGDLARDQQRSAADHRSLVSLLNLSRLEPDPSLRALYRKLLDELRSESADEANTFHDMAREVARSRQTNQPPTDLGSSAWALALLPAGNAGTAKDTWNRLNPLLSLHVGGIQAGSTGLGSIARDALPPNLISPRGLLWQNNPRAVDYDTNVARRIAPPVDFLLPYWMGMAAGARLEVPPIPPVQSLPRILPAELVKSSGEVGLEIGTGTAINGECRDRDGKLLAAPELVSLPGPYGVQTVPATGLDVGWTHVRMLTTDNDWKLTVNPQADAIQWNMEVCRAGGIEKPGSEVRFLVDIVRPARAYADPGPTICPAQTVASSGEQRETLSSSLFEKSSNLSFRVDMPLAYQPLLGPPGRIDLTEQGYEDASVRIQVLSYTRVQEFYMIRDATGLQLEARIRRPGGFGGGAEIKVLVELRAAVPCPQSYGTLPSKLTFTALQGGMAEAQSLLLSESSGRPAPLFAVATTPDGVDWLRVVQTSSVAPSLLWIQPSAVQLSARAEPYQGALKLTLPGAASSEITIPVEFRVNPLVLSAAPLNDTVLNASTITGRDAVVTATLSAATLELGEPQWALPPPGQSAWWRWQAPSSGPADFSTQGTTADTLLSIYQRGDDGGWERVGENDNVTPALKSSAVRIEAIAGETYWISLASREANASGIPLKLSMPEPYRPGGRTLFPIRMLSVPGHTRYTIEASEDLVRWEHVSFLRTTDSILSFSDATPSAGRARYYRARAL